MKIKLRSVFGCAMLMMALPSSTRADGILYNETFEGVTPPAQPAGWFDDGSGAVTASNPDTGGINPSAQDLTFPTLTAGVFVRTSSINLTGFVGGNYSIHFDFDLYSDSTTQHHLIIGSANTTEVLAWFAADGTQQGGVGAPYNIDLTSPDVWQHFSLDITSQVADYASTYPSEINVYSIAFEDWNAGGPTTGQNTSVDNLKITAVPEPATWGLLTAGMTLGLAVFRRWRIRS